ncbi:MAG: DUF480 domain-containing protein [candidate division KSB1 bacterium]|nr:DUF480 domain-containing protein [candidate division KSB1 bacterium]MDZ7272673.1 DUF480 domain-containing protein [candidate division KSB1 bacterium]MDZ7284305.1 DUF480 domain-containing protein [candidate division KSB1 bacterium]MDZ7297299.1 DUF480 domain-containing protein [candidate division KSB1 bacterium]MDZ7309027.1 DUF480 domain-containing protein [candidate division KSB1 bacterium]
MPTLSPEELRVLGCLIEKSQATPEYYPMTLNALVAACNQKTSRDPVVEYQAGEVEEALSGLREKGWCAFVHGEGRVVKYAHRAGASGMGLSNAQMAALSLLLLRGPQTAGEIKSRALRQHEFKTLEEVAETLASLQNREPPLVAAVARQPGQKEERYRHCLGDPRQPREATASSAPGSWRAELAELKATLARLQEENAQWRERLARLEEDFARLRNDLS